MLKNNNKAFTLVELIVVMSIIGILVLLATPSFLKYIKDANVASLQVDVKIIRDGDLYKNLKAFNEAGLKDNDARGNPYLMKDITSYDSDIFTGGNGAGKKPDFGGSKNFDFDKWKLALASTFQEETNLEVLDTKKEKISGRDKDEFLNTSFAALNAEKLSSQVKSTSYGINNFIVALDGPIKGQVFYMGYLEDGNGIMFVSLIPSKIRYK